jgi:hypothetical protein
MLDVRRPNFRLWSVGHRIPRRLYLFRVEWFRRLPPEAGQGGGVLYSLSAALVWEPRDLWCGIYRTPGDFGHWFLYLCAVPCLPLRLHYHVSHGAGGVS